MKISSRVFITHQRARSMISSTYLFRMLRKGYKVPSVDWKYDPPLDVSIGHVMDGGYYIDYHPREYICTGYQ